MAEKKKGDYWENKVKELLESQYAVTGSLFPNKQKKLDMHPDYQGCAKFEAEIDGIMRVLIVKESGWVKLKADQTKWIATKLQLLKIVNKEDLNGEKKTDSGSGEAEKPEDLDNPF
jgi:hypothetical protein